MWRTGGARIGLNSVGLNSTSQERTNGQSSNSFPITAADGSTIAVPAGEYYFNTKARVRRMMLNSLSSEARQVYACLELATMGFKRELAVKMVANKRVPLTPSDIGTQTGLTNQNVRLALIELEQQGLAERQPIDATRPLQKGNVQIYSWATPRELKCKEHDSARGLSSSLQIPDWFPESWAPLAAFIKRHKLSVVIDQTTCEELLVEGETIARHYQAAEIVVSQFLERVCARTDLYKEERTERTTERKGKWGGLETTSSVETPEQPESPPLSPEIVDNSTDEPLQACVRTVDGNPSSPLTRSNGTQSHSSNGVDPKPSGRLDEPDNRGANGKDSARDGGPLPSALAISRLHESRNPRPDEAKTALVVVGNPNSTDLFEVFCFIMDGCGRPVSVPRMAACRQAFFRYPLETQQRIIDDSTIRSQGKKWDDPTFVTDPLKYLNSQVWDTEPITARKFAPPAGNSKQQQRDDALRRLMEQSRALDRERGPLR